MYAARWLALVAALVGAGALLWHLRTGPDPAGDALRLEAPERGPAPSGNGLSPHTPEMNLGGTYAGVVVDEQGRPIPGATVLLMRFEAGLDVLPPVSSNPQDFDAAALPQLGGYHVSAEVTSDAEGRFSATAGARHLIQMVVAWHKLYALSAVGVATPDKPLRVVLTSGGRLKGRVVDPDGRGVAGAVVEVYLQQIALPSQNPEEGVVAKEETIGGPARPIARQALLGQFLGKELGPRVWGLEPSRNEALTLRTDAEGLFHVGPLDGSVQVWVVVSHPDFMWTDFDEDAGQLIRRPVLKPGELLERTYTLERGKWIQGRVITDTNPPEPVGGVMIRLDHVTQYKQHPFYRDRSRVTVTREDGSFRMAGLSYGPYKAMLNHGSFGSQEIVQIPENTSSLVWVVQSRGGLAGTLRGLTSRPPGGRIELVLEPLGEGVGQPRTMRRERVQLDAEGAFRVDALMPGDYRVSVRAGEYVAQPQDVSVRAREVAQVTFDAAGGAQLALSVLDRDGRAVDPATVSLVVVGTEGRSDSVRGTYVTRQGRLDEDGLVPGRYRVQVWASGFLATTSEPFDLVEGRRQVLPALTLSRPAWLRVSVQGDARGRVPSDLRLELAEGEATPRTLILKGSDLAFSPGAVTVRAHSDAEGLHFERTVILEEGKVVSVDVQLR